MAPAAISDLQRQRILRLTIWAALAALLFSRMAYNVADLDIWHEMSLIRASLAAHRLVTVDTFAYGPRLPLAVDHEWGSGVIAYFLATTFGPAGILVFKYLVGFSIAFFAAWTAKARGASLAAFSVLAPLAVLFGGAAFSPIRGHMYSLWFAALLLWLLEQDRRGQRRWLALWLALFPLWVNLHGGFVVGIGFMVIYAVEQALSRQPCLHLFGAAAAMAAMVSINPFGLSYYPYLARALTMARPAIGEWRPVWDSLPGVTADVFLLSLALLGYLALSLRRRVIPGFGIVAISAGEAALHQRMMPFFALSLACYAPAWLDQTGLGVGLAGCFKRFPMFVQALWMAIAVFFAFAGISYQPWSLRVPGSGNADEVVYPAGAVDYLQRNHFRGNVMTPFEYGAYVSWKLYPAVLVSLDSRYEVAFPNWWIDESFRFYSARPGWEKTLASYPTDLVMVRNTAPVSRFLAGKGWAPVYRDGAYRLYARPGLNLPAVDLAGRTIDGTFP